MAKRKWFAEMDYNNRVPTGRYFRNCPLIMTEREAAIRRCRLRLASKLAEEWARCWREGVIYADRLGRRDVIVRAQGDHLSTDEWVAAFLDHAHQARA